MGVADVGITTAAKSGVGVVNVDNGFGAGYLAALINQTSATVDQEA